MNQWPFVAALKEILYHGFLVMDYSVLALERQAGRYCMGEDGSLT